MAEQPAPAAGDDDETPAESDPTPVDPGNGDSGNETPGGETPGGETPGGETPGGETPGGETPGGETPGGETPGGETPGGETPGGETPGGETPGGETPVDPTPVDPTPVDPTPVDPTPVDPTPVDPTPETPTEPATPVEPTPETPVEPAPETPAEPVVETPTEPAPERPTPIRETPETTETPTAPAVQPKPVSGSGTLRAPTAADLPATQTQQPPTQTSAAAQSQQPLTSPAALSQPSAPVDTLDPIVTAPPLAPDRPADDGLTRAQEQAARDAEVRRIVHSTLVNLGIVPADPAAAQARATRSPSTAAADGKPLCAPVIVSSAAPSPAAGTIPAPIAVQLERKQRLADEPATVRGPPISPVDAPSSPLGASASIAAGASSPAGFAFVAILVGSVSAQLAAAESVAPPCSFASNSATPQSDLSARGPPAV